MAMLTVRNAPLGQPPRKSEPSTRGPVELPNDGAGSFRGEPNVSFGAPEEDRMSIAASEEGLTPDEADESAEQPPSGAAALSESEAELAAMLLRAAKSIDLEVPKAPSPERSRLDDWFLGSGSDVPPRSTPVPFFPEVHEELTKTWRAPYTARSRLSSSLFTTLDGSAARGYVDISQVERVVAVHLCPQNAATWRNRPRLSSKACKLSSALAAKAYSAAGQAASALHAMAILQVHQAKALKQLHQDGSDPRLMQELRTTTDFALRAAKVTARSLGQVMSTMVVQERQLWLNLAQMSDADKVRFLNAPISQAGLFWRHRRGLCPAVLGGIEPATGERRRPVRVPLRTPASPQSGPDSDDPEIAHQGTSTSVPPLPGEGREGVTSLLPPTFRSVVPNHSQKEQFSQSLGLSPRVVTMSEALLPQVRTRSMSSPTSREPGVKVRAVHRSVTLLQNASSSGLGHLPPQGCHSDTDASVLCAEIAVLLAKNAIEPVPPTEMKSGFYSPYFIIPKKSGGLPFRMLTAKRILSCIRHQVWFAAIDLKDAYFHVPILPRHRPFLRFAFEGRAYQYRVLPFGLALSPRVFTKVVEGALSPLWERGIRILNWRFPEETPNMSVMT
ncbi:hypothetical protein M9458_051748 [Cirrhinus mrigala]|uniref:ribonuclease H n=1 Tax=Cirrhinus mrigala TaxID=683832 RepID=A0ABD0MV32_CIRMR